MRSSTRLVAVAMLACLLALTACSRKGGTQTKGKNDTSKDTSSDTGGGSVTSATFGTLHDVCGPNSTGKALTASDRGVTPTQIKVTTISDPGFTGRPGLNQELFDASTVFTKWCNDLGGINGRKIVDTQRDAAIFNYKQKVLEACPSDFALVGGGGVFDDTGQNARLSCLLPDFPGYVVSPQARGADLMVQAQPFGLSSINMGGFRYVAQKFPESITHMAYLTANVPTTLVIKKQYEEAGKQVGLKSVYDQQYNTLGETTWVPFAQSLKLKGAQGLFFVGEPANLAKLEIAFKSIGYYPKWILVTANFFDRQLIDLSGGALKNTYIQLLTVPNFDAAQSPALTKYLDLFKHYLPTGKSEAVLGVNSFSAWLLFAQTAKQCGVALTRKCLYETGKQTRSWDGGGLTAEGDPSSSKAPACDVIVYAEGKTFGPSDQKATQGVFNCGADHVAELTGDYGKGATLAGVGKSLADLK